MGLRMCTRLVLVTAILTLATGCGTSVFDLEAGTCFNDPASYEAVSDVDTLPCSQPHDKEVFSITTIPGAAAYPGDEDVWDASYRACVAAFDGYVGIDYLDSIYEVGWFSPTPDSWGDGDREVVCFLFDPSLEVITGSVKGSGT